MQLYAVQDYVGAARTLLQDTIMPYRYDDESLVTALNMAWYEAQRIRPDIAIDPHYKLRASRRRSLNHNAVPLFTIGGMSASVPLPPAYKLAFLYFIVGQAQFRDTEDTQDSRAAAFMQLFESKLKG
jgi:hypothetical protein